MYCALHNTALALCVSKVKIYINGSGGAPVFLLCCVLLIKVNNIIKVLRDARWLMILFCVRYFRFGRYAGYTPGSSEYSVKSLTEREAAKLLSCPREAAGQRLYSPCSLNNKHQPLNNSGSNGNDPLSHVQMYRF